jgi:hypothetical protein
MAEGKSEILPGAQDLMVLKTLAAMGPFHGYGIAIARKFYSITRADRKRMVSEAEK